MLLFRRNLIRVSGGWLPLLDVEADAVDVRELETVVEV
jgi:hypothetical protein